MSEQEDQVIGVVEAYKATAFAKDIEGHVALYDPEVRIFDLWGDWSYDGREAWRPMAAEWLGSLGDERVAVDVDGLRVTMAGETAYAHGTITYRGLSREGRELRSLQNRVTWVFHRRGGTWKIVHQHTSAPIDAETMKVTLRRS